MKHEYEKLKIWQNSRILAKTIYEITAEFPENERFVLVSQLRRSAISIASNIAEGSGYNSNKQFTRYLNMSIGSLCEIETQLIISKDLKLISEEQLHQTRDMTDQIKRMIIKFKNTLD